MNIKAIVLAPLKIQYRLDYSLAVKAIFFLGILRWTGILPHNIHALVIAVNFTAPFFLLDPYSIFTFFISGFLTYFSVTSPKEFKENPIDSCIFRCTVTIMTIFIGIFCKYNKVEGYTVITLLSLAYFTQISLMAIYGSQGKLCTHKNRTSS